MGNGKTHVAAAMDWTQLMADPALAQNFGKLLQAYRDAPPERREEALASAVKKFKQEVSASAAAGSKAASTRSPRAVSTPPLTTPPFKPDVPPPRQEKDRRRHPRIKCFVAVELRVNNADSPVWGNLSNTSLGGCQVETAAQISGGAKVEIGLWVASGKIWVKGVALNGVVTHSAPGMGLRIRFTEMEAAEKENLRQFLRCVHENSQASKSGSHYLQLLK